MMRDSQLVELSLSSGSLNAVVSCALCESLYGRSPIGPAGVQHEDGLPELVRGEESRPPTAVNAVDSDRRTAVGRLPFQPYKLVICMPIVHVVSPGPTRPWRYYGRRIGSFTPSSSIPVALQRALCAAGKIVPVPAKGSSTVSPGRTDRLRRLSYSATGFWAP